MPTNFFLSRGVNILEMAVESDDARICASRTNFIPRRYLVCRTQLGWTCCRLRFAQENTMVTEIGTSGYIAMRIVWSSFTLLFRDGCPCDFVAQSLAPPSGERACQNLT